MGTSIQFANVLVYGMYLLVLYHDISPTSDMTYFATSRLKLWYMLAERAK